jgi:glucose-6-phosphate 1-dehydrogenase
MLFARRDWVELSWSLITPILEYWRNKPDLDIPSYPAGGLGPKEAMELIEQDGRRWRTF